uniref:Uncharacterized protein n=1 Tax=Glossina austeni TaxID=7395 RepID=A0A1A9VAI4_GLOAU
MFTTERIKQLAKSKKYYNRKIDGLKSPMGISPRALKAVATERTIKLAKPRVVIDMTTRSEPFKHTLKEDLKLRSTCATATTEVLNSQSPNQNKLITYGAIIKMLFDN